ncbi:MAG: ribonuclease T [Candidatus Electrothrix sp. AR4]|nr:ribonuclease T [Candidatus Electrothrix sp. AR4]
MTECEHSKTMEAPCIKKQSCPLAQLLKNFSTNKIPFFSAGVQGYGIRGKFFPVKSLTIYFSGRKSMKKFILAFMFIFCCDHAIASEKVSGTFKATETCYSYVSFKKKSDPIKIKPGKSYQAEEVNKAGAWKWIRVSIKNDLRWVSRKCGTTKLTASAKPTPSQRAATDEYLLSVSWQSAFCESRPNQSECKSQTNTRFDASHFVLHGLWPQPDGNFYCGVSFEDKNMAKIKKWCDLPELNIDKRLRFRLDQQMPGTQSCLDRYEWIKHGTCYNGKPEQIYFTDALALLEQLNASAVQKLFAEHIGRKLTVEAIRNAFALSFGAGAGERVKLSCKKDGQRNLIVEMRLALKGNLRGTKMADVLKAAEKSSSGCREGIVDPAGLQ